MKKIQSVAIYCHNKPHKEKEEASFIRKLLRFFYAHGIKIIHGDLRTASMLHNGINRIDDESSYDLKIGIGGDGTLLKMIRTLHPEDGHFLGINFGTLGFLSELTPQNALLCLEEIMKGHFVTDERILLKSFVYRKESDGFSKRIFQAYALNEVVFGHGGLARLVNFEVEADKKSLSTYRSDGLIVSTPTGSSAYSLSAGGAILYPSLDVFQVTPVAPHTLTHRPIVLPSHKDLNVRFNSRSENIAMTIDGQIHFPLKASTDYVTIEKANRTAKFIRMKDSHYFKILKDKLGWGSLTI